jgi:hypothetical protein
MTVRYNESGDLVYIDKRGNEIEIDIDCSYCELCDNTHLNFAIPVFGFETEDNEFYGDMDYFDEFDGLNADIEDYLSSREPFR